MKSYLIIFTWFLPTLIFAQNKVYEKDSFKISINNVNIDSIVYLKNNCSWIYATDSINKYQYLIPKTNNIQLIEERIKTNFQGYIELGEDFQNYILVKIRGDGSGNPESLWVINKKNGSEEFPGEYPFYIDRENEIIVYIGNIQLEIRSFKTGGIEKYDLPNSGCLLHEYWEITELTKEYFTLKYINQNELLVEIKILRTLN